MRLEDGPPIAALAVEATRLVRRVDAVPLPPSHLVGWASPAARAYAHDVLALQHTVARLQAALAELAVLLAGAAP